MSPTKLFEEKLRDDLGSFGPFHIKDLEVLVNNFNLMFIYFPSQIISPERPKSSLFCYDCSSAHFQTRMLKSDIILVSGGNTLLGLVLLFMNYRAQSQKSILQGQGF